MQLPRASTWSKNARKVNSTQSASVICILPDVFIIEIINKKARHNRIDAKYYQMAFRSVPTNLQDA